MFSLVRLLHSPWVRSASPPRSKQKFGSRYLISEICINYCCILSLSDRTRHSMFNWFNECVRDSFLNEGTSIFLIVVRIRSFSNSRQDCKFTKYIPLRHESVIRKSQTEMFLLLCRHRIWIEQLKQFLVFQRWDPV